MNGIKIGEKISCLPIIQGGMGVGISLHRLAGTVAREGGIGVISAADIGFRENDFKDNPKEANLRALKKELTLARKIAGNGIIGVNVMRVIKCYEETVKACVQYGADLIISGAGLPLDLPAYTSGSGVAIAPVVSSARAFELICRRWIKRYDRVPDLVVVEGSEAGGHLGFSFDELENGCKALNEILKEVIVSAEKIGAAKGKKIPIIAAGGIYDKDDIARVMTDGAAGVQMGTRFVVTEECDAAPTFKSAYINSTEKYIRIIHSPVGMPGRAIYNDFLKRVEKTGETISDCTYCMNACHADEVQYCITEALVRSAKGDTDNGLIFCGTNAARIKEITTVKKLLDELFPQNDICQ